MWRMVVVVVVKKSRKPFVLGSRGEEVLKAMHFYRYMTALDVCYLMYSPSSLTTVRSLLAWMCGGEDFVGNQYLYRFRLPDVEMGKQKIDTLGSRGRKFLESELGIGASWYFRPEKERHMSYGQIMHSLVLTRFLVASRRWAEDSAGLRVLDCRICYELAGAADSVEVGDKSKGQTQPVVPDGWIVFERQGEKKKVSYPVLLEIDRGSMYKQRFKRHVRSRIEFVRSGGYEKMFGTKAVLIVYATTGEREEYMESRVRALCEWTMEVLEETRLKWGGMFRICGVSFTDMYKDMASGKPVWFRPDRERPVGLFDG